MRRIAVFSYLGSTDSEAQVYTTAFLESLQGFGWTVGRNLQVDYRWTQGDAERVRSYAAELAALAPDAILVAGGSQLGPMQQASRAVPIVFVQVSDAVAGGFIDSLARPGGNATGFVNFEFNISAKWLELLKQVAPRVTRVAVLRDPRNPAGTGQFGAIQAVAPSFGIDVVPVGLRDAAEIQRGVDLFARENGGGLIVTPSGLAINQRELIIALASQHSLPAIYPFRYFVTHGGLLSYGPDVVDQYRRAAGYVDRVLKGEKPADLPVQRSSKVELVINLKTAKALGLAIPQPLILRADEVIR